MFCDSAHTHSDLFIDFNDWNMYYLEFSMGFDLSFDIIPLQSNLNGIHEKMNYVHNMNKNV